jgi:hypothetical protein
MPHSQGSSAISILSRINTISHIYLKYILILSFHVRLGFPKAPFPEGLLIKILKVLLRSSVLATWHAHLNPLDLIILTIYYKNIKMCYSQ